MDSNLLWINQGLIAQHLSYERLIEALRQGFSEKIDVPLRHHHQWGPRNDELLMMPACDDEALIVKLVTLCPGNQASGLDTINGVLVLFDGEHGQPLAVLDAAAITVRRTAAASALASSYLSRSNSQSLLMVGTGALASHLIAAHLSVRDIKKITVWGRDSAKAASVVAALPPALVVGIECETATDLQVAVAEADIVSMATSTTQPLIKAEWLSAGTHLDLVGAYRPDMREVDSETVRRASLFCDTRAGVLTEAGDIVTPISEGVIDQNHIQAELAELCSGHHRGRQNFDDITLFKSVGTALEDLVAAKLAYQLVNGSQEV